MIFLKTTHNITGKIYYINVEKISDIYIEYKGNYCLFIDTDVKTIPVYENEYESLVKEKQEEILKVIKAITI